MSIFLSLPVPAVGNRLRSSRHELYEIVKWLYPANAFRSDACVLYGEFLFSHIAINRIDVSTAYAIWSGVGITRC